jgi:hypothetical protein
MSLPPDEAWFPAKRFGYGWGIPRRWQGWLVLMIYFGALIGGASFAQTHPVHFASGAVALSVGLFATCLWKGEPPRWRWGDPK